MYIRRDHQFTARESIFALIEAHPLGAWVCDGPGGLIANHIPFLLDRSRGEHGTLIGHVARANAVWRSLAFARPSVIMFQGPQAYISPGWYPGKQAHGKVVPTWDYAVAHAHGVARAVEDRDWLIDMLTRLTDANESTQPTPWRINDAPASYIDRMLRAIVGIEIPIDRMEGKLKASQDEAMEDRIGTVGGLRKQSGLSAGAMASLVRKAIDDGS